MERLGGPAVLSGVRVTRPCSWNKHNTGATATLMTCAVRGMADPCPFYPAGPVAQPPELRKAASAHLGFIAPSGYIIRAIGTGNVLRGIH